LLHNDDGGTATRRNYLGKAVSGLQMLTGLPASDVWDTADGGDVSLLRQSLYWVTERQYYSCSPSLKPDTNDNRLSHVTVWEFVGIVQSWELPRHIRANARGLSRGWPPSDRRDGSTVHRGGRSHRNRRRNASARQSSDDDTAGSLSVRRDQHHTFG